MTPTLDYFYGGQADQYTFFRVPKLLFTAPEYRGISAEAKILYGLLLDRMTLSARSGWFDEQKCILQLRGVRPFLSEKYDITQHPQYKHLSDADKKSAFNIEDFLAARLYPKPEEVYEVYEIPQESRDTLD